MFGRAEKTFSNGHIVWDGSSFHNQHKGSFIKRGNFGYTYRRHPSWTAANDPLKFKVDRSTPVSSTESPAKLSPLESNEFARLTAQVKRLTE